MKGVVLAGGLGTRLYPCTEITNKHLLPVYNKPMIFYPLETLSKIGCKEVMIVIGPVCTGEFLKLIGDGKKFGFDSIYYAYQSNPVGGIVDALKLAKNFVGNSKFCLVLGDNLILDNLEHYASDFNNSDSVARVFLKEVANPSSYGVATLDSEGKIISIDEKPAKPKSNLAVTGVYMYDYTVFEIATTVTPSRRGELEISDINHEYVRRGLMTHSTLEKEWLDTGSFEGLYEAASVVRSYTTTQGPVSNPSVA